MKLFGMLFGLGAWATLPAVIGGYLGNPNGNAGWIESALIQGTCAGRWPDNALELNGEEVRVRGCGCVAARWDGGGGWRGGLEGGCWHRRVPPLQPPQTPQVVENKFSVLPVVGSWGRRPLELATLRLQNMVGVSISNWSELAPDVEKYPHVLTQLGGCTVVDGDGEVLYEFKDPGICAVANFDDVLAAL